MTELAPAGTPLNQSIERAARLLGFFTPQQPELTLAELTERLGANKAATHRYTMALRRAGLLRFDAARGVYSLGPRIVEYAAGALAGLRIIKIAAPHMERLAGDVNETAVLSVWDGESPVVIHVADNTDRIARVVVRVGARLPLRNSAQGTIFEAFGADAVAGNEDVRAVRRAGVSVSSDVIPGIRAIATPVFQDRDLAGAIALVGTNATIPDDPTSPMARKLLDCGELVSRELGFIEREKRA